MPPFAKVVFIVLQIVILVCNFIAFFLADNRSLFVSAFVLAFFLSSLLTKDNYYAQNVRWPIKTTHRNYFLI